MEKPLWQRILELSKSVPKEEWEKVGSKENIRKQAFTEAADKLELLAEKYGDRLKFEKEARMILEYAVREIRTML